MFHIIDISYVFHRYRIYHITRFRHSAIAWRISITIDNHLLSIGMDTCPEIGDSGPPRIAPPTLVGPQTDENPPPCSCPLPDRSPSPTLASPAQAVTLPPLPPRSANRACDRLAPL